ncbi:alpha/beta hydrolase [Alkalicella caledoniensis]|uniref:Alpha/beta hydrolase n=1 Tax=Alkalicella caledoniensis TaxID=2731377 RepID=A0A7G9W9N8_ALKCA|nr:hypothetical protein [Alkalicella caledoniensis]QNO15400.1 alpha/beta hydrolase [Alkalicella caledoniensis]
MGIIIFLTGLLIEIALLIYCVISQSQQQKVKGIIRIMTLVLFAILIPLQVIQWSFRYYFITVFLFAMGLRGLVTISRKSGIKGSFKPSIIIRNTIVRVIFFFIATLPAILFPQYDILPTTGSYEVSTVQYIYIDENRVETFTETGDNRKLNVGFWYPENGEGTYPLIIFSHGGISTKTSNESLYNELASHGYIVASIDHTYHSLFTTDDGKAILIDRNYMKELNVEDAKANPQQSHEYYQKWMNVRTGDINFVIDYIISKATGTQDEAIYELVDIENIGVMGHSLGGSAALAIGRTRTDIKAVIALESPFMGDILGVKDGQFVFTDDIYPIPVLNIYSDSSWNHLEKWPQYKQNYNLLSETDGVAYNIYISGAGHFTLSDLGLLSPILSRVLNGFKSTTDVKYVLEIINEVSLEFFNSYLKGQGEFDLGGSY